METAQNLQEELNAHYPLTSEQADRYQEKGYIKLKNVLTTEAIDFYGQEITRLVLELNQNSKPMEERTTYEKAFIQIINLWTKSDTVKEFVFSRRLGRIAAELMRVKGVRMYHDQALYKEPGGGFTPWHADQYYWPLSNDNTITVWIPLQNTPLEMGPLMFAVGSQTYRKGRDLAIGDESEQVLQKSFTQMNYPIDNSAYDLGEVSFHSGWTFHRAGPNQTGRPRAVMTVIYMEDGIRLAKPKSTHQEKDCKEFMGDIEVGDVVNGPLTPVIYRSDEA